MTDIAIDRAGHMLSGLARGLAVAASSPSIARKQRLVLICQQKLQDIKRQSPTQIELDEIEQALKDNRLDMAIQLLFAIHPFPRVGERYPMHDTQMVLYHPKPEANSEAEKSSDIEASIDSEPSEQVDEDEDSSLKEQSSQDEASLEIAVASERKESGIDTTAADTTADNTNVIIEDVSPASESVELSPEALLNAQLSQLEAEINKLIVAGEKKEKSAGPRENTKEHRRSRMYFWDEACGGMAVGDCVPQLEPAILDVLNNQQIHRVADLLYTPPKTFLKFKSGTIEENGEKQLFRGQIIRKNLRLRSQLLRYEVALLHKSGALILCSWLSKSPRGWSQWKKGQTIALIGSLEVDERNQLFEAEPAGIDGRGSGWLPCYDVEGIDDVVMRELMCTALEDVLLRVQDPLPRTILQGSKMLFFDEALREAHFPSNPSFRGFERLIFDETFYFLLKQKMVLGLTKNAGVRTRISHAGIGKISQAQDFRLSDIQEVAFSTIRRSMISNSAMRHILQGDIGAGKWSISLFSLIAAAEAGAQVLYACTDIITAERRYWMAESILKTLGISCQLCSGEPNKAQQDAMQNGVVSVVFGCKDILSPKLRWKNLRLLIVEESKEYGAMIPHEYMKKNPAPDVLVVTPTPISSRILDLVYPTFSLIQVPVKSLPASPINIVQSTERTEAYAQLKKRIAEGQQGYIVFPVKDGRDLLSLADANQFASAIQAELLEGVRIAVFSSELDRESRRQVLEAFQQRRVDVLLCTTFIEDSPTLPNASAMVIEYAELNTVSRLHRLRGHVSRGYQTSYSAWLTSEQVSQKQKELLEKIKNMTDGYQIAEIEEQINGLQALIGIEVKIPNVPWTRAQPQIKEPRLRARNMVTVLNDDNRSEVDWGSMMRVLRSYYPELKIADSEKGESKSKRRKRRYHKPKRFKK